MIIRTNNWLQTKLICLLYKQEALFEGYIYTTPNIKRPYTVEEYQANKPLCKLTKEEVNVLSIMQS